MVIHQPRVAWDGALAFVRAAASQYYGVYAAMVFDKLGRDVYTAYEDTRERIFAAVVRDPLDRTVLDVEAGKWRVRLEDLLRADPELAGTVQQLAAMAPRY
jgi:hypothetical protein